jgi:ketol-acid reductoisomerase
MKRTVTSCHEFFSGYIPNMKTGKTTIIGYGPQGQAWAMNLLDSGRDIIIGLPRNSKSRKIAENDGFKNVATIEKAVEQSRIIVMAFPDHLHGRVYKTKIKPFLGKKSSLVFLHAFSIHFGTVVPTPDCNIILLAPLGPGISVRNKYLAGESMGYFYSIHQDGTGDADRVLNQLIKDMKVTSSSLVKTTMADEAVGDLFGEQAVLCGGLTELIKNGYETLVEGGLSPDKAYLEVAYQLDLIIDLIKKHGISGMYDRISVAARLGSFITGSKIIDKTVKRRMEKALVSIKDGSFARKLDILTPAEVKKLKAEMKTMTVPSFEKAARRFSPIKDRQKS